MKFFAKIISVATVFLATLSLTSLVMYYKIRPYNQIIKTIRFFDPVIPGKFNTSYYVQSKLFLQQPNLFNTTFIGDSNVSYGSWNTLLPKNPLDNRGIAGDTTDGILKRLKSGEPVGETVIILAGVNDPESGIPLERTKDNFNLIIENLRGKRVLIVSTILTSFDDRNKNISNINNFQRNLCSNNRCHFVDVNKIIAPNGALEQEFTIDGIHLNWDGYRKISPLLERNLELIN